MNPEDDHLTHDSQLLPRDQQTNKETKTMRIVALYTSFSSCQCLQQSTLQINSSMCKPHHESRSRSQQNRGFFHGFHGFFHIFLVPRVFRPGFSNRPSFHPGRHGTNHGPVSVAWPARDSPPPSVAASPRHGDVDIKSLGKMVI